MYSILIGKDEKICANCKHYYPHYVRSENGFQRLREGHCSYPRMKTRDIFQSCAYFAPGESEGRFVRLDFEEVR